MVTLQILTGMMSQRRWPKQEDERKKTSDYYEYWMYLCETKHGHRTFYPFHETTWPLSSGHGHLKVEIKDSVPIVTRGKVINLLESDCINVNLR